MNINSALSLGGSLTGKLTTTTGPASSPPNAEEIAVAGKEFESVFMSMLLKNMRSTVSEDGMFAGDNSDTFGSMFDLFMSQHLAKNNSLGIGTMIERFLENTSTSTED